MDHLVGVDWEKMFVPSSSLLEIFLRGSLMYVAIFVLLRVVLKRQSGAVAITDVLVIVLIADAAQNGMAGEYTSVSEGILLVGTILVWSMTFDWLAFRFPAFEKFVSPPPVKLVEKGRLLRRNMRREFITEDELMAQVRKHGLRDLRTVKAAFLEGEGNISVTKEDGAPSRRKRRRPRRRKGVQPDNTTTPGATGPA